LANWPWRGPGQLWRDLPARLLAAAKSGHIERATDFFGGGYVAMAIEDLKAPARKVDTIADFDAVSGSESSQKAALMPQPQRWSPSWRPRRNGVSWKCRLPESFALDDVREAYRQLELRHTRGKLVAANREWRGHR